MKMRVKNMKRAFFLFFFLPGIFGVSKAQDVQFTATAPGAVYTGDVFEVTYTVTGGQPGNFKPPTFSPFIVIAGPSTGYSSYTEFSNGKLKQVVSSTYTYRLQAGNEGKFKLGSATANVSGKSLSSNELNIEVVKSGNQQGSSSTGGNSKQGGEETLQSNEDLYAAVLVDKKTVWQGQSIVATLKIFDRKGLTQLNPVKLPNFKSFYKSDIPTPALRQLTRENINGKVYGTGVIARYLLFPQLSGDLIIEPAELQGMVERTVTRRSQSWWDLDIPTVQQQEVKLKTRPVAISVKPLPPGAPEGFAGAVGSYKMNFVPDKTSLKTNEALTIKLSVSGSGNLSMIQPPELKLPPDFELYKPKTSVSENSTISGNSGTATFEYVAIARHPGDFEIPAVSFSFFDPASASYRQLSSGITRIHVEKGENDTAYTVLSGISQEDVKFIGKDILFIKARKLGLRENGHFIISSHWYFAGIFASIIA